MKKLSIVFMLGAVVVLLSGCTENSRAKNWGGTMTIDLPQGKEFVNATWKDSELWYIVKDKVDDIEETYEMIEDSSFGVMQGKVIFKEHK